MGKTVLLGLKKEKVYPARQYASLGTTSPAQNLPTTTYKDPCAMPPDSQGTRIAVLETRVGSLSEGIGEIKTRLDGLQTTLDEKTLPVNSLTWKLLAGVLGSVFALAGIIIGTYTYNSSAKISAAENKADQVQNNLNAGISSVNSKIDGGLESLKNELGGRIDNVHKELQEFIKLFVKTSDDVATTTKRAVTAPKEKLGYTLPTAQKVLAVAKEKGIPLKTDQIQELAKPLLNKKTENPALAQEIQKTLSAVASYKTFSDGRLQPLPQEVIEKAKADGNYFLKQEKHLGERQLWKDVIFKDCEIVTGSGSAKLILENVSFINCTFRQDTINDIAGERLNAAIIDSPGSTISVDLYNFPIPDNKEAS